MGRVSQPQGSLGPTGHMGTGIWHSHHPHCNDWASTVGAGQSTLCPGTHHNAQPREMAGNDGVGGKEDKVEV